MFLFRQYLNSGGFITKIFLFISALIDQEEFNIETFEWIKFDINSRGCWTQDGNIIVHYS